MGVVGLALGLPSTGAAAPSSGARAEATPKQCRAQAKRLTAFKRTMKAKRNLYFRSHKGAKARRAFVRKQNAKLKALKRAHAQCLKRAKKKPPPPPPPPPPPSPPPPGLDSTPPELAITSPAEGSWFDEPPATVRGTAIDLQSGVDAVTCNGQLTVLSGSDFNCAVTLTEGVNRVVVRAVDRSGNARTAERTLKHGPGLLSGGGNQPALEVVKDFDTGERVPTEEISVDADGRRVARTILEIAVKPDASVDSVNSLLDAIDARIVSMLDGVAILVVEIPDPGTLAALDGVVARVRADPVVRLANKASMGDVDVLPANYAGTSDHSKLAHHLGVRAPAAWNAAAAIEAAARPTVIVGDNFGDDLPNADFAVEGLPADDFAISPTPDVHGYFAAGVIAATFAGDTSDRGLATGIFPGTTRMRVVDKINNLDYPRFQNRLIRRIEEASGNVVVTTSLNDCAPDGSCDSDLMKAQGLLWIERVRGTAGLANAGAGLESKFLHLTSAGNIKTLSPSNPASNSPFTAARMFPNLSEVIPHLTNTLVIENAIGTGATGVQCLNENSKRPGDLSAVGTDVWSLAGARTGATFFSGTSFSTPQAAGLAAYVWALDPSPTPQQLATLLRATADPVLVTVGFDGRCDPIDNPARFLDAYQAVLSLDTPLLPAPGIAPIRFAILDSDGEDGFEGDDLADYEFVYFNNGSPVEPTDPDYSRWDLNGDGFTGGAKTAKHDLDRVGSTLYGPNSLTIVERPVEGIPIRFDETKVTDVKALCFYANSPLYTGDPADRAARLGAERCLRVGLDASFPTSVSPGVDTPLTLRADDLDLDDPGNVLWQRGVRLELTPTGGTVGASSGVTAADGTFQTTARLSPGQSQLTVDVVARAGLGGPELARTTVTAAAAAPALVGTYTGTGRHFDGQDDPPIIPFVQPARVVIRSGAAGLELEYRFGSTSALLDVFSITSSGNSFSGTNGKTGTQRRTVAGTLAGDALTGTIVLEDTANPAEWSWIDFEVTRQP